MRILITYLLIAAVLVMTGCTSARNSLPNIYDQGLPKDELSLNQLNVLRKNLPNLDAEIITAQQDFGVPQGLLRCMILPPLGMGSLTPLALDELNDDVSYEAAAPPPGGTPRLSSSELFKREVASRKLDINTSIYPVAAYLNNKYVFIKSSLESAHISYDPTVLWFFALAAYHIGPRAVFTILTHEGFSRGEKSVESLLTNLDDAFQLMTRTENLLYPLRRQWKAGVLDQQVALLTSKMSQIQDCISHGRSKP